MSLDRRFIEESGQQVFTGSELLVKGALEAAGGVHLLTGAPGVPLRGYFDALEHVAPILQDHGQVARIARGEAAAIAMVRGAQLPGCRAIAAIRSAGLATAAESLTQAILAGSRGEGGGVIVCGDDPWTDAVAAPFDSRFLAEHARLPLLEPASPQEIKDWIELAFRLGKAGRIFVGFLLTAAQAEGGGTVWCKPNQFPRLNALQKRGLNLRRLMQAPAEAGPHDLDQRLAALKAEARRLNVNQIFNRPNKGEVVPLGFVASGAAYAFLSQALAQVGLGQRLPVLKLGLSYPVDEQIVIEFARHCRRLIVVEERRSFVERQVVQILAPLRQAGEVIAEVFGKQLPGAERGIPDACELHPSLLIERLAPLLRDHPAVLPMEPAGAERGTLAVQLQRIASTLVHEIAAAPRTPTFCPGCPHRDTSSVLLELRDRLCDPKYMLEKHKRKAVELICHADAGCSSLMMQEPNRSLMAASPARALGAAAGRGADSFIENKQLVFMGDGTFYQHGLSSIAQAIHTGQDVTFVILDNYTTALTGRHQHRDRTTDLMGRPTTALDIERTVEGMIPRRVRRDVRVVRINPADRDRYGNLLEQSILADGVKIIIADKECGITRQRRVNADRRMIRAEHGYLPRQTFMNVATEVCDNCHECTRLTGCTALSVVDTDYGPKIQTDLSACVDDRACQRVGACPSFERVTVIRRSPPSPAISVNVATLPDAPRPVHADNETWRCFMAGVGGMGVSVITTILTSAGREMGYQVQFIRHNGAAVRNGGVFSQLLYTRSETDGRINGRATARNVTTAAIPYGGCDLMLGVDLLEAVRGIDPGHRYRASSPDYTAAVINDRIATTVGSLMGNDRLDADALHAALRRAVHPQRYVACDASELGRRLLGSTRFANIILLGVAYQSGYLPLTHHAVEHAIRATLSDDAARNLQAFAIGRQFVVDAGALAPVAPPANTAAAAYREKLRAIRGQHGRRTADRFARLVREVRETGTAFRQDGRLLRDVIVRAHDCLLWGGIGYAQRYARRIASIAGRDDGKDGFHLTHAAVWNLARVMLIKDEVYVSRQLTSPQKYERDRQRFNVHPENGDQIIYRHYHRPEFVIFGKRVRFGWMSKDWQLRLMAQWGWLRVVMPGWHKRERRYRDWFEHVVDQVDWEPGQSPRAYQRWVSILRTPESVSGFREVWYPRMTAARRRAEELLATDPELFEPPVDTTQSGRRVSLPIAAVGLIR